jgi:hypothetical protein
MRDGRAALIGTPSQKQCRSSASSWALQQIEQRLDGLPDGPQSRSLRRQYLQFHDQLADVMAR